ncbi:TIGR03118 family protein [Microlunatus elymi]|uniref:TIGR03118 family protein n=1 Tax=Microlunatus elymi TaxID=2596828 RepID=A0A516PXL3_9ACTN|nr:TIGR03118 family protein [Microlunatus elymi]QDP95892.1 TIGR03118 family protein [Microlunatus elymi]
MVAKRTMVGAAVSVALTGLLVAPPGAAGAEKSASWPGTRFGAFREIKLVSDQPGVAALTDPDLVNPWGMSRGPNTPVWVSDNGADVSTLYRTDTPGAAVTKVPLVVSIPGGAPTGQVANDTTAFTVPGTGQPARFIFIGEDGDLSAWNQGTAAVAVGHTKGAVYKGLALVHAASGPRLVAANFGQNRIDVFDGAFQRVPTGFGFRDPFLPRGYAPFNVAEIGGRVFVTYALQDAAHEDDVAGPGHGFVDVYSTGGRFLYRFANRGVLNSPWGLAIAPSSFGRFADDLLIGNFGDGRIHAFDQRTGALRGALRDGSGRALKIDGLWGLLVGDQVAGGTNSLWFSAGPDDEQHGLLGLVQPAMP